jgi:hypothetical protein
MTSKRLSIRPHLVFAALERRYRTAKEPVARSHWQMIWLLVHGQASEQVAAVTGYRASNGCAPWLNGITSTAPQGWVTGAITTRAARGCYRQRHVPHWPTRLTNRRRMAASGLGPRSRP